MIEWFKEFQQQDARRARVSHRRRTCSSESMNFASSPAHSILFRVVSRQKMRSAFDTGRKYKRLKNITSAHCGSTGPKSKDVTLNCSFRPSSTFCFRSLTPLMHLELVCKRRKSARSLMMRLETAETVVVGTWQPASWSTKQRKECGNGDTSVNSILLTVAGVAASFHNHAMATKRLNMFCGGRKQKAWRRLRGRPGRRIKLEPWQRTREETNASYDLFFSTFTWKRRWKHEQSSENNNRIENSEMILETWRGKALQSRCFDKERHSSKRVESKIENTFQSDMNTWKKRAG